MSVTTLYYPISSLLSVKWMPTGGEKQNKISNLQLLIVCSDLTGTCFVFWKTGCQREVFTVRFVLYYYLNSYYRPSQFRFIIKYYTEF